MYFSRTLYVPSVTAVDVSVSEDRGDWIHVRVVPATSAVNPSADALRDFVDEYLRLSCQPVEDTLGNLIVAPLRERVGNRILVGRINGYLTYEYKLRLVYPENA